MANTMVPFKQVAEDLGNLIDKFCAEEGIDRDEFCRELIKDADRRMFFDTGMDNPMI